VPFILPDGEWSCPACTLINPVYANECDACNTKKPSLSFSLSASRESAPGKEASAGGRNKTLSSSNNNSGLAIRDSGEGRPQRGGIRDSDTRAKRGGIRDSNARRKGKGKLRSSLSASFDESDEVDYGDYLSDDEANMGLGWEAEPEMEPLVRSKHNKFKILNQEDLSKMQMELIASVSSGLGVNKWDSALLLQHFKWDVNRLHADYWDQPKRIMKKIGIKRKKKKNKNKTKQEKNAMVECLICADDIKASKVFSLGCRHGPYCNLCWENHLAVTVKNSSAEGILNTTCMWPRCPVKLNRKAFKKLAAEGDFKRYEYFFRKNYVDNTKELSWCPNPSCMNAVQCVDDVGRPADVVHCTCGNQFCFACGMENHNPVTCDQLAKWQQRNSDDQESIRLVMATSKPCFHCGIPTTRVEGCNHMTCQKQKGGCGGEWCWMCRGDWKSHGEHTGGYFSCNKYDNSGAKDLDNEAARLKEEADRYLHYFNRYFLHETAAKSIPALREKALDKQRVYREITAGNPDFLLEAVDLLERCRHILKYTYVYGFYLPDGSRGKDFFEYLQANAEGITERLSGLVNSPVTQLDVTAFKNTIRVTSKYIENLVEGMEDGLGVEGLGSK
jgi:ariadne-1